MFLLIVFMFSEHYINSILKFFCAHLQSLLFLGLSLWAHFSPDNGPDSFVPIAFSSNFWLDSFIILSSEYCFIA